MNDAVKEELLTDCPEQKTEVLAIRNESAGYGSRYSQAPNIQICRFCGRTHKRRECFAYGLTCHKCGKKNHFAACCPNSVRSFDSVKYIALKRHDEELDTANKGDPSQHINTVASNEVYPNKITTNLMVDDHVVKFQVDSGATCDVVRLKDLNVTKENLQTSSEVLQLYDESRLTPLGRWTAELVNPKTGKRRRTSLIVVEDAPTAIVGAATSQKFGLITIHYEQLFSAVTDLETGATTKAREQIICKFQSVFNDELLESSAEKSV